MKTKEKIVAGKPIKVEAPTREECAGKVRAIRKEAEAQGLKETAGGFISLEGDAFVTELNFVKP